MSRFGDGLRIIPRTAWTIAVLAWLSVGTLIFAGATTQDREMSQWPVIGRLLFSYGFAVVVAAWILLAGFVYADAKRRGMRYVMWTWLSFLLPYAIGTILYFILRDPLPRPCAGCGTVVKAGYTFCPHCGAAMQPTCPQCGKAVEAGWSHCPHCGAALPSPARPR